MKLTDIVHEVRVVVSCVDRENRIEFDGSIAFSKKGDDGLETAVFKVMKRMVRLAEGAERKAADEAYPF